jgi:hypothetical protein
MFIIALALPGVEVIAQEEIAPFKLTNVDGSFALRYYLDERSDTRASGVSAEESTRLFEDLFIRTRSYVYHPALLEMLISGGTTFSQDSYDSNTGGSTRGSSRLLTYSANLRFLSFKAYPFTVFFTQSNPEVAAGLTGRFNTVDSSYGITGRLRKPLFPVEVNWRASHADSEGSGFDTTVDNSVDRAALNTSMHYKNNQSIRLDWNWLQHESRSGSLGLPIRETLNEMVTSRLTGKNSFGEERKIKLNQYLERRQEAREGSTNKRIETLNYNSGLSWDHSDRIRLNGNYRFLDSERDASWNRNQNLGAGAIFRLRPGFQLTGSGSRSSNEAPDFSRDSTSMLFQARYERDLPFAQLVMTGSLAARRTDQYSATDIAEIFEESVFLVGSDPVFLQEEFVVTSSVMVTNVELTQVFIEDIDYRLITIGSTTTLERLVNGNITDGQEVLVSYDYQTGGTVEYGSKSQSIGANLNFAARGSLFLSLANTNNDILSGIATTPLNDRTVLDTGGKFTFPFLAGWAIGGDIRYTQQDEEISPFVRTSFNTYLQFPRYWNTQVRLGMARENIDYELSREDVARINFTLNIDSRLPGGLMLSYRGVYSENDGGSYFREDQRHNLRLDWRYRKVIFSLHAAQSDVGQDESRREDTRVSAVLRRYF